uniref:Uncharacterized protein n=2 Tax=unclassified Candidatus Kentrum TaxID=2643149 RepID=A0A451AFH3_9GAMM|nr:MAG: hypothetical protein BECKLPF1236B_GA0070989_100717 [Candidatus Kentron sp. LPFa]VFK64782.1 MAG: hypothetical protein BECKUNK1418G_GA0071005_10515 [Candidatus Kentron sp. UNK]VFK71232.1 MAG: hypothetical protein BECKUNK1418H_GA0071006_10565 [Candidatus Kentron sp. UNK]
MLAREEFGYMVRMYPRLMAMDDVVLVVAFDNVFSICIHDTFKKYLL